MTTIIRKRASVLRYTYIACLVNDDVNWKLLFTESVEKTICFSCQRSLSIRKTHKKNEIGHYYEKEYEISHFKYSRIGQQNILKKQKQS
jgi:hypothetical protein